MSKETLSSKDSPKKPSSDTGDSLKEDNAEYVAYLKGRIQQLEQYHRQRDEEDEVCMLESRSSGPGPFQESDR